MSSKLDFSKMNKFELRAYVLEHREDEAALHAYLDKLHAENPNARLYQRDEDVAEAIAEHMAHHLPKEAY
jgi:hypothetical protein